MRLYTNNQGAWAGTQADAKKLDGSFELAEVPTDKATLLEFLNEYQVGHADVISAQMEMVQTVVDDDKITGTPTPTHQSSTPVSLFEAAKGASLSDLQHVVYRYLEKIDDELDLRRST